MSEREPLLRPYEAEEGRITSHASESVDSRHRRLEPQDVRSDAILRAQGQKPEMERNFSSFAAVGLGFRYGSLLQVKCCEPDNLNSITNSWVD